jgi:nucleolar pre-ribosomal-associated protein 2
VAGGWWAAKGSIDVDTMLHAEKLRSAQASLPLSQLNFLEKVAPHYITAGAHQQQSLLEITMAAVMQVRIKVTLHSVTMLKSMQPPLPAATRPQLQAINQTNAGLDEQIHQAAHIIGLPNDWDALHGDTRTESAQRLVRARADWVLRWVLDKLKDTADNGSQARANVKAWKLAECMIHALPTSRCAPHLRDAHFLTVVERTLEESFGADIILEPTPAPASPDRHYRDASESSETVQEDTSPTRKRKRGSETNTPSKRAAVQGAASAELFDAVRSVIRSIRDKADSRGTSEELVQGEHMLMVLRTESAQAARILKCWLNAVQKLTVAAASSAESTHADLSLAVEIWELRTIDPQDDIGASTEQFSTECLVSALLLSQTLQRDKHADCQAIVVLNRLLAKHVLNPSRTAFHAVSTSTSTGGNVQQILPKADLLSSSLEPLRAKLLQAAQIEDAGDAMPPYLSSLFPAVPQLLDLVVRFSPARTPKSRNADKPWIQAAFVALAECAGCSLEAPEFLTPPRSIDALQESLRVLASHDLTLNADISRDLFWFHSGVKFPLRGKRTVHWPLIAALTKLDPDIYLADPSAKTSTLRSKDRPDDLAKFLFDQISTNRLTSSGSGTSDGMLVDGVDASHGMAQGGFTNETMIQEIIVPIMSAFARNRNLRGFLDLWSHQLSSTSQASHPVTRELGPPIWEHDVLISALADVFEASLTLVAIKDILQEYVQHVEAQAKDSDGKEAHSKDIIVQAVLQSIKSNENIEALKPQLQSLWTVYSSRVLSEEHTSTAGLAVIWVILCQLLLHLWPVHLHGSAPTQEQVLYPLVDQAASDVTSARKNESRRRVDSRSCAAALGFFSTACNYLQSLPGNGDLISKKLQKVLKAISPTHLETQDLAKSAEIFCAAYASLLGVFASDTCQAAVYGLLLTISGLEEETRELIAGTLSQSVFAEGSLPLQAAFTSACLKALSTDDVNLHSTSVSCFLQTTPLSIAREQRESVLDSLVSTLHSHAGRETALLSIVAHIMEVPNATATISSDGAALFDLAQRLHDANLESRSALHSLQSLAQSTLTHILPNKDQTQNKRFIEKCESKVISAMKKSRKCFPLMLAILRGTFLAAPKDDALISIDQYVELLTACLNDGTVPALYVLKAFGEIPLQAFQGHAKDLEATRASLRTWITSKVSLAPVLGTFDLASWNAFPSQLWSAVFVTIAKYQFYPDTEWLAHASSTLLRENLSAIDRSVIINSTKEAFQPLKPERKLHLIDWCLLADKEGNPAATYQLINVLVSVVPDKLETEAELKEQQLALLPKLCSLLGTGPDDASFNIVLDSITIIIRDKHSLTTQHSIECVLTVLLQIASRNSPRLSTEHAPAIFARLCATTRTILLLHRGRLGGRFHLLVPLLQNLLLCLFIPNGDRGSAHPPWLSSMSANPSRLTPHNASQFTRLLSTLCSPTQSSVQRSHHSSRSQASKSKKDLNDPVRAAREYASQFVYPLLSSYCRFQLYGRLEPQVRRSLMAGIWDVLGVASMDRASLDSMFAGLGKSERDVWKGVWQEWERANGRKDLGRKQ